MKRKGIEHLNREEPATEKLTTSLSLPEAPQVIDRLHRSMERAIQMIEEAIPHLPTQEERLYQGERLRLIRVAVKLPRPNTLAKLLDA
jgi:sugar diacid utilization regulator